MQTNVKPLYASYLAREDWRCEPSGAHHWVIDPAGVARCVKCGGRRNFEVATMPSYWCNEAVSMTEPVGDHFKQLLDTVASKYSR